jgi:arabinose-5-phosphate isomerase
MRAGAANPVANQSLKLLEVIHLMSSTPGRPGAVSLVDDSGRLVGFYTDGDLRRQLEHALERGDLDVLRGKIADFMTRNPLTITAEKLAAEALKILRDRRVDQLPVVDAAGMPIGLLDVQDLLDIKVFA